MYTCEHSQQQRLYVFSCAYQFIAIAGGIVAAFGSGNDFVAFGITSHFEVAIFDCQSHAGQKDADENDDKDTTYKLSKKTFNIFDRRWKNRINQSTDRCFEWKCRPIGRWCRRILASPGYRSTIAL